MNTYVDYIHQPQRGCAIVAHRGAWHAAPENSLLALEHAINAGYPIAEIDIRQSADGELYLLHDDTLARMTGMVGEADDLTIAQLTSLRLRNRDGGEQNPLTEQHIPTLREALQVAKGRIFLDLDTKYPHLIPLVAEYVKSLGMSDQVDLKASVQNRQQMQAAREMDALTGIPFMPMVEFTDADSDGLLDMLREISPFMCEVKFDHLTTLARRKARFSAEGIALWVNTLDEVAYPGLTDSAALEEPEKVWGALLDAGVSVIQTDEPAALQAFLRKRE